MSMEQMVSDVHNNYQLKIKNSLKNNLKKFWSYANRLKKDHSSAQDYHLDGNSSLNNSEASELFADFFSSVYEPPGPPPPESNMPTSIPLDLNSIHISIFDIFDHLKKL